MRVTSKQDVVCFVQLSYKSHKPQQETNSKIQLAREALYLGGGGGGEGGASL